MAVGRATDRRNRGDDGLVQQRIMERLGGGQRQAVKRAVFNLFPQRWSSLMADMTGAQYKN